ncbi:FAD-binding oxidoreductase [Streptomyces sp. NPDC058256]|uniref:FAD-binding oxidoreductase n=1 Tax=Streptomyces sp. NPDC058256 TaxID=3346408 RepID=UPI0036E71A6B
MTGISDRKVLDSALATAVEVVGPDRARVAWEESAEPTAGGPNISMFRSRRLWGTLYPSTVEEVQQLVRLFDPTPASIHPYSTGRNWGLGSREAADDDAVALCLSGLDRIREVDVAAGYSIVEPGVTQACLARRLDGTDRMLNLTASSARTSILGNGLDRGVGLRRPRIKDIAGLEVVLPNGDLVRVGQWPGAPLVGPNAMELFVQSGLGVVTAGVIRLLPRPEAARVLWLSFPPEQLSAAGNTVRRWARQGLTRSAVRIYDPNAATPYGQHNGRYLVHICIDGTLDAVEALTATVLREAEAADLDLVVPDKSAAELVEREYTGSPDLDDTLFRAKLGGHLIEDLEEQVGLVFFLPHLPFSGEAFARADATLAQVRKETGAACGGTFFTLDEDTVLHIIAVRFNRDDTEANRAHRALDLLHELFAQAGFLPSRLDIDHTSRSQDTTPNSTAPQLMHRIRNMLDPHETIAPGRYGQATQAPISEAGRRPAS